MGNINHSYRHVKGYIITVKEIITISNVEVPVYIVINLKNYLNRVVILYSLM